VITTTGISQSAYVETIKNSIDAGDPIVVHINDYGEFMGGHSVVAYDYDEDVIYAHYGRGGDSSTYELLANYDRIYYVAKLDYSSLKHSHSNNYVIDSVGYCGCNLSDEVKIYSGGSKFEAPVLYWMDNLENPSIDFLLIHCINRFSWTNPSMILGYVFFFTTTNSVALTQEQWSAIWDIGGHDFTVSFSRTSEIEEYVPSSTKLNFLGIEGILNLNVSSYDFAQYYVPTDTAQEIANNNTVFNTNRLRCGRINDTGINQTGEWYIVLSAKKNNAGTAYLSYDFDFDFNMIDIDISFWALGEGLDSSSGTARIEYKDSNGLWVSTPALDLLNDVSLSADRTNPNTYTVSFPDGTRSFRIISTVNNPSGTSNKTRICVGDLVVFNR
jgi:hypothetical protein